MTTYREWQPTLHPTWLADPVGIKWGETFGLAKDMLVDSADIAVQSRFIATSTEDTLAIAGADRGLPRAPSESADSYRARLIGAWDAYAWAGTKKGLLDQLALVGYANVSIVENFAYAGPDYDASKWWRFWVTIYQPHDLGDGTGLPTYGGGGTYGGGMVFGGLDGTKTDLIKRIIRKWKPAHAQCVKVTVVLSGALWGDFDWGDGTTYGGVVATFVP